MFNLETTKFRYQDDVSNQTFPVHNPNNLLPLENIHKCTAPEALSALAVADSYQSVWKKVAVGKRAEVLEKWAQKLEENSESIANTVIKEQGKPLAEALGEVNHSAMLLRLQASAAQEQLDAAVATEKGTLRREGVGVTLAITPWNFPVASVVVKVGAALASGCTVLLKPAEETPITALYIVSLAYLAGVPLEALQVLTTDHPQEVAEVLIQSPKVRMISFTGSIAIGREIMRKSASTVKQLGLELGGNAPFIVLDDADAQLAARETIGAKFYNSGQICIGANRFLISKKILEKYLKELKPMLEQLDVGPGKKIGPMIDLEAAQRINNLIADALSKGAYLSYKKQVSHLGEQYIPPQILTGITPKMKIYNTEIFGPVIAIRELPAQTNEESIWKMANDCDAGLAGYVFTSAKDKQEAAARELEVGMLGINTAEVCKAHLPFGGIKQSGLGHEGGPEPLNDFLVNKCLVMKGR